LSKFVPYLTKQQIERDAAGLLTEYAQARGTRIQPPIPIEDIIEKHLKLRIEFDDAHRLFGVPRSRLGRGPDILGAIFFDDRHIVIDESLDPDENPDVEPRYRFTLAHEGGGHWRLHRALFADAPQAASPGGPEIPSVVCRANQGKERIEWQADYHSSCLLMPRQLLLQVWRNEFGSYDPVIYEQWRHGAAAKRGRYDGPHLLGEFARDVLHPEHVLYNSIASNFAPIFGVSRQAMRIRLIELGLLLREAPHKESFVARAAPFF
jgi:Zn-dependent peptidase ImmA (M78 family)